MGQLDSKVAIVIGANSGIGRAFAIQLAKEGAIVVINYAHAQHKAEQVRQTIEQNRVRRSSFRRRSSRLSCATDYGTIS